MTEEEKAIEKMYEEGLVNVSKIAEPLINKYKELDYQQCQFVIEYLLADRQFDEEYVDKLEADIDSLEKKNKRYEKYLKNKDEEHNKVLEFIETEKEKLQSDIEIKDKVIKLITEDIAGLTKDSEIPTCKEAIIDFYYKKVEEENVKN